MTMGPLITAALCALVGSESQPPNLLIFLLDDHGWADVGANDPTTTETPHMDGLVRSGIRFQDMHVGFSVCTPSRAALLTGRLCPRTGVCGNFAPTSTKGMALGELTIADILSTTHESHMIGELPGAAVAPSPPSISPRRRCARCALAGKWHLGHRRPYHPTFRGFRTFYGLPYSGDMGCLDASPQGCTAAMNRSEGEPACPALCAPDGAPLRRDLYGTAIPLYDSASPNCSSSVSCDAEIVEQPFEPCSLNARYTARATHLLGRYRRDVPLDPAAPAPPPFFLYVAYAHTHTPLAYAPHFENASSRAARVYGNTLAEVDASVGEIVGALERYALARTTLTFLLADNGPADLNLVPCDAIGSTAPFVGAWQRGVGGGGGTAKTTTWEGGHRVLGAAAWAGRIPAGVVSHALVSALDILPTIAALSGVSLPADRSFDGVDLTAVLLHGATAAHSTLFHPQGAPHSGVVAAVPAMRLGRYKAHYATSAPAGCMLPDGSHRHGGPSEVRAHDPPLVFDLETDPGESTPLAPSEIAEVLPQIDAALRAFWRDVNLTMRSDTDFAVDWDARPCANPRSSCCRLAPS
jgi:arylsulfatase G